MFTNILFPTWEQHEKPRETHEPPCFKDLNLGQMLRLMMEGEQNKALASVYYTPVDDLTTLHYRHDVLTDLEEPMLRGAVTGFSDALLPMCAELAKLQEALTAKTTMINDHLTRGSFVNFASGYCMMIDGLVSGLSMVNPQSEGMKGFVAYVRDYAASEAFRKLKQRIGEVRAQLDQVQYTMLIKYGSLRIRKYEGQPEQSPGFSNLFARFLDGNTTGYKRFLPEYPSYRDTEVELLRIVSGLFPEQFQTLDAFCAEHVYFVDETIQRFATEVRFYLNWISYIEPVKEAGLPLCFPSFCDNASEIRADELYDLALAHAKGVKVVTNDIELTAPERILVVTGPNQGGKTTFARAFGQLHWLSALGLSIPARHATMLRFDRILTLFEKEEDLGDLSGKLLDDLRRLKTLLDAGSQRSLLIVNEIFSSTTMEDATLLGNKMLDSISEMKAAAVIVTFLDALSRHGKETVSLVSAVDPDEPGKRTYRLQRKPADGLAYASVLAARHGLSYEQIRRRLAQ